MNTGHDLPHIGIVGLQDQGRVYADLLTEIGIKIKGADVSKKARKTFENRYNADTYEEPDGLLDTDIDAVVVTSPNKYHLQPTITALEEGYHVFVEKPLAHDLESARRIVEVERSVDQFCMCGSHFKFAQECRILKKYIEEGYFGDIYHIETKQSRRRGIPGRGSWYTSKDIAGGGAAMDIGTHAIDLLLYFLDASRVEEMMAVTRTNFGHREDYTYQHMHGDEGRPHRFDVEDSATALIRVSERVTANVEIAWAANTEPRHEYHIHGTDAGAYVDLSPMSFNDVVDGTNDYDGSESVRVYESRDTGPPHFFDGRIEINRKNPFVSQFEYFIDAVQSNQPPEINSAEQALNVQRVISQLYESDGE